MPLLARRGLRGYIAAAEMPVGDAIRLSRGAEHRDPIVFFQDDTGTPVWLPLRDWYLEIDEVVINLYVPLNLFKGLSQ